MNALEHPPFPLPNWQVAEGQAVYGTCLQDLGHSAEGAALLSQSRAALQYDPRPVLRRDTAARLRKMGL